MKSTQSIIIVSTEPLIIEFAPLSDFHSHVRSPAQVGKKLFGMNVRMNCEHYEYVVVEPNTFLDAKHPEHHIETADDMLEYQSLVKAELPKDGPCKPLFLLKLTPRTRLATIRGAARVGCVGFKMYPEGVTVGSNHGGVSDFYAPRLIRNLEEIRDLGLILQIHPEMLGTFCLRREHLFHEVLRYYAQHIKGLRIFVEHITDRRTLKLVRELRAGGADIYGTITGHHLELTLDDVLGQADHHCWPCAKYPEDRDALRAIAFRAPHHIISITDSAPHEYDTKHPPHDSIPPRECSCAGVFNPAKIAIPWLVEQFENQGKLEKLLWYASLNGLAAYGLSSDCGLPRTRLIKTPWQVPRTYDSGDGRVTPFRAGKRLQWQIVDTTGLTR